MAELSLLNRPGTSQCQCCGARVSEVRTNVWLRGAYLCIECLTVWYDQGVTDPAKIRQIVLEQRAAAKKAAQKPVQGPDQDWTDILVKGRHRRAQALPAGVWFERDPESRQSILAVERLDTDAPSNAIPYCCYMNTVIFYAPGWRMELDRVDYSLYSGVFSDKCLWHMGSWWQIGGGEVHYRPGIGWVMAHTCWRNHRTPIEWNHETWLHYAVDGAVWRFVRRLTRPLRDLLRTLGILPGRPQRGQEVQWEVRP